MHKDKKYTPMQLYIYSITCGVASFGASFISNILHPLELIKIRFQSHDGKCNTQNLVPKYNGVFAAIKEIYKAQGLRGLYKGFMISFMSQSLSQAIFFIIYEKRLIYYENDLHNSHIKSVSVASMEASIIGTVITQPLWIIKTRIILNMNESISQKQNFIKSTRQIYMQHGLKGYFRGILLSLLLCFNGFIQMFTYESSKLIYQYY